MRRIYQNALLVCRLPAWYKFHACNLHSEMKFDDFIETYMSADDGASKAIDRAIIYYASLSIRVWTHAVFFKLLLLENPCQTTNFDGWHKNNHTDAFGCACLSIINFTNSHHKFKIKSGIICFKFKLQNIIMLKFYCICNWFDWFEFLTIIFSLLKQSKQGSKKRTAKDEHVVNAIRHDINCETELFVLFGNLIHVTPNTWCEAQR